MHIVFIVLLVVVAIIVLLLILGIFMRKEYRVQSEVVINAPLEKVFDYVRMLRNQDHFNKWIMRDLDRTCRFKGVDGTVGFVYGWKDNKGSGEGEQEITGITEGERVDIELRFIKPFTAIGYVAFVVETVAANQTRVTWSNKSALKYPMNIMVPVVERLLPKDMHESLNNLKRILEQ